MANNIDINVRANDLTSGVLGKIGLAVGGIGGAIGLLTDFVKKSITETEKYVTSITDMSRVLGLSTEETSRLVQASDDLFITQEKLTNALVTASGKGIDVSIDGIKKLSEEYLALAPGVERAEFVIKTFGQSNVDMAKILEVGTNGIDEYTQAVKDNLIVTTQSKINIENYKRSVDNLQDSWQGIKYTIGNEVIPQLDLLFRVLTGGKDDVEKHMQAVNLLEERISRLAVAAAWGNQNAKDAIAELQSELDELNNAIPGATDGIEGYGDAAELTAKQISEMTSASKGLLSMAGSLTSADEAYSKGMEGVAEDIATAEKNLTYWTGVVERAPYMVETLTAKLDELTASGDTSSKTFKETEEKLEDWNNTLSHGAGYVGSLSDKVDEQKARVIELAKEHEKATHSIILGYVEQMLAADGLSAEEAMFLIDQGIAWGIYSENVKTEMEKVMAEADLLITKYNSIPTNITTYFNAVTNGGPIVSGSGVIVKPGAQNTVQAQATGGYVAGGNSYLVGERGPELFTPSGGGQITPNGQLGGGGMEIDYDRMTRSFIEALERSSLVR